MRVYRVYFNRLSEAPLVWSIDEGTQATEINVMAVRFAGCNVVSRVNLNETDAENRPEAWLEAVGWLRVECGVATIRASVSEME